MKPERFETWLTVDRKGLYCRPGGFHIDPYGGAKRAVVTHGHSDHARPGHDACAGDARDARGHDDAARHAGDERALKPPPMARGSASATWP